MPHSGVSFSVAMYSATPSSVAAYLVIASFGVVYLAVVFMVTTSFATRRRGVLDDALSQGGLVTQFRP